MLHLKTAMLKGTKSITLTYTLLCLIQINSNTVLLTRINTINKSRLQTTLDVYITLWKFSSLSIRYKELKMIRLLNYNFI